MVDTSFEFYTRLFSYGIPELHANCTGNPELHEDIWDTNYMPVTVNQKSNDDNCLYGVPEYMTKCSSPYSAPQ